MHLAAVDQVGLFPDLRRHLQCLQRLLHRQQTSAFARQHHDVSRLHADGNLPGDPGSGLAGLQAAQGFFLQLARCGQAVAPQRVWLGGISVVCRQRAGNCRQPAKAAGVARGSGVRTKAVIGVAARGFIHHRVDRGDHSHSIAPGVVAGQHIAAKGGNHKCLRGLEHLRLGAAKTVNALFWVAHQKHAGRWPCPAIPTEPRRQCLPLQRVGVLKLVNHQMLDARVQPLLHPTRQHRVAQHGEGGALHIVHVNPAALTFQRGELRNQQPRQPGHALLVNPGVMLLARRAHTQHQVLRGPHCFNPNNFFTQLARRAGARQQRSQHALKICIGNGLLQRHTQSAKGFCAGTAERLGSGQQQRCRGCRVQSILRRCQAVKIGILRAKGRNRGVHYPSRVSQRKLGALVQRSAKRLVGLKSAMRHHNRFIVAFKRCVCQQCGKKPPPHQCLGGCVVFQKGVVHRQLQLFKHCNRTVF